MFKYMRLIRIMKEVRRMKRLVNLTPHELVVMTSSGEKITLPPSGRVARVSVKQEIVFYINNIPVVKTMFSDVQGLPEPQQDTVYIVSTLVLTALKGSRNDVIAPDTSPDGVIRDESGKIIAVKRFQVI